MFSSVVYPILTLCLLAALANGFSVQQPSLIKHAQWNKNQHQSQYSIMTPTALSMSSTGGGGGAGARQKSKSKKRSTIVIDKTEEQTSQQDKVEEQWRVVLHNDEVHTFNYVIQSLCKVIGTLDRKRAFDICVLTHGTGKATITKSWKQQAMKYCLGLQRQGLTASIAPESKFTGEGGGEGGEGGGEGGGGPEGGQ